MEVQCLNNVKIYDLSRGQSYPHWLTERERRNALRKNIKLRQRIELIQDFCMPDFSNSVCMTRDGQYIIATGMYKPRIRCYDVHNLSMKFEYCFDAETIKLEMLSEDYTKPVILRSDSRVEFYTQSGKYHDIRVPQNGRDMVYHRPSCDLYMVGSCNEVFRFNLEKGRYLNSLSTDASELNVCAFNSHYDLFVCGTVEGRVEAWDPRVRKRVGILDCAFNSKSEEIAASDVPEVTSLCFKDGLMLAVGTSVGQVHLYDLRSSRPMFVKDHMNGLPIKKVEFHPLSETILSMDSKVVKIWHRNTGNLFTYIEPLKDINDMCVVPNSGLMFFANEDTKLFTYYVPSLGPAPRWCNFLDNITEELEETTVTTVYDDYKFLSVQEVEDCGLAHLIGSRLLRAYMHGYFVSMRLYLKVKSQSGKVAVEERRQQKMERKIEETFASRVQFKKQPKANKELAEKLNAEQQSQHPSGQDATTILKDDRFKAMFEDPDFELDEHAPEYGNIRPMVKYANMLKQKQLEKHKLLEQHFEEVPSVIVQETVAEGRRSSDGGNYEGGGQSSSVSVGTPDVKPTKTKKKLGKKDKTAKFFELKAGEDFRGIHKVKSKKLLKMAFADRMKDKKVKWAMAVPIGDSEMTFTPTKKVQKVAVNREAILEHKKERQKIARRANNLLQKDPPKFWMGSRIY